MARKCGLLYILCFVKGLMHLIALADATSTRLFVYTYRICENAGPVPMKCFDNKFLNVTNAVYGRLQNVACSKGSTVTDCQSPLSMMAIARLCHGLSSCTIEALSSIFGDPCPGVLKYLEVSFTCLSGDRFPSIPRLPDAYVYSNQGPMQAVLHLKPNSTSLRVAPFVSRIFRITETSYDPRLRDSVYDTALDFLSTQLKSEATSSTCHPSLGDFRSQFCIFEESGYVFTSNTFIPGMYVGKSYDLQLVVRDHSPIPFVGKTTVRISAVPVCFPLPTLYSEMKSRCPSDHYMFTFPSGRAWSHGLYGSQLPISVVSPITISRIFIDTDLLVGFKRNSSYWNYSISFSVSDRIFVRKFVYVPSTLEQKEGKVTQAGGPRFNITIEPPINVGAGEISVNISLKLINTNAVIKFNSENAVYLYGTKQILICPDSFCMNPYRAWKNAIEKLKHTQNFRCITDESLQEVYLQPCNSGTCFRRLHVPLTTPAGSVIYQFQEHDLFQRFRPTFYRVIYYEYDGEFYPGHSDKYFCSPQPFSDSRRFICLNRYRGRLRVRSKSAPDFRNLTQGSSFTIEIQAEATINNTLQLDRCKLHILLTMPTTTSLPTHSPSSSSGIVPTSSISSKSQYTATHVIPSVSIVLSKPLQTTQFASSVVTMSHTRVHHTSQSIPTTATTTKSSGRPAFNESLQIVIPKDPLLSNPLNITCLQQTGYQSTIRWYKDGVLLQQTGRHLIIASPATNDQGVYRCEMQFYDITVTSDKKLVTFKDVFTSSVYLGIVNRQFTTALTDPSSTEFKELSADIVALTGNAIKDVPTSNAHDVYVEKYSKGSVIAQVQISSPIGSKESISSYYARLSESLLIAANRNYFGSYQIPATGIIIVNKESCLAETSNLESSKGPYNWPFTRSGETASVPCANGPSMVNATRKCNGDFSMGAFWGDVLDPNCNFNSKRTEELNSLSETIVNSSNAESVASGLGTLTENVTSLTTDDTLLASKTFSNLAASNVTSDKVVDNMLQIASNLLQANQSVLAASQAQGKAMTGIIKGIEAIADNIQLPNETGQPVVKVASGLAIQAIKLDSDASDGQNFALQSSNISLKSVLRNFNPNEVEVGLQLPASLLRDVNGKGETRLSFVAYGGNQFFQSTKRNVLGQREVDLSSRVNGRVISAHVKGVGRVNLSQSLQGSFKKILNSFNDRCVFWDFKINDGYGGWSSEGCRKSQVDADRVLCHCDHMTNFAIIFDPYAGKVAAENETHEKILGIISFIGIGLSLGGLFLTLLTLFLFRRLRRALPPKILIHLCLALMFTLICFVIGADRTESIHACRAFAILIQYFMLATFCWMTVEALNLYLSFVVVMGSYISRFIVKAAVYAWGLPIVMVAVTASLRISDYGNERNCVVSGWAAYGSLFIPVCVMILINFVALIRVLYALRSSAKGKKVTKDQRRSGMSQLRIVATFSCILGLTWVSAVFAVGDGRIAFQYLFCIFNSLQGFTIFYLHVARHTDARNHWIFLLTGKGFNYHRATISSSSHKTVKHNDSTGFRMRTSSSEQSNRTITSTAGRQTQTNSSTDFGSSFA